MISILVEVRVVPLSIADQVYSLYVKLRCVSGSVWRAGQDADSTGQF